MPPAGNHQDGGPEQAETAEAGETSRRTFLKATTAATSAGALGALTGCLDSLSGGGGGGGSETTTVSFLSAQAAENADIQSHFQDSMKTFEEKNENVKVDLQTASYGDIKSKLSSTVSSGNPPAFAESGSGGLQYFFNDKIPDHSKYIEETDGMPDDFTSANQEAAKFRGEYWSAGAMRHTNSNLGIRPKLFSQVGVQNPMEELSTWSGFLDAIQKIDQQTDAIAYEETGVYNDLESYWGYARTAYTGGTDPWLRGDPKDPTVVVANENHDDQGKTDGMIKTCVKLADQFSSPEAASRGDEEIPSLMVTGKVASFTYATPTANRWRAAKDDVKIGWNGGNGDYMLLPNPKVDPEFGSNFGISELEGVEGDHGGHVWSLEQQQTIFKTDEKTQSAAWDLNMFLLSDEEFVLPAWGEYYEAIPGLNPMMDKVLNEYDLAQSTTQAFKNLDQYGDQYASTGAAWDVKPTDQIRWTDINETISQAIAGQHNMEETPQLVRQRIQKTLKNQNN
ncbi:extracellular solute-binding protein [Halegenticoccus soli]|uniref:extracellular solute-binding protein n=1 Tax=Halegenticoccus soli TaxID=1985678 RepID=UPI00117AA1BC|nr:extracellular solute-binding protein [Halegenticoccus soli]